MKYLDLSIVIPAFNEENTIIEILERVNNQNSKNYELEIIVIDDSSTDSTKELLDNNPNLYSKFISLKKNLGKGGAVKCWKKSVFKLLKFKDVRTVDRNFQNRASLLLLRIKHSQKILLANLHQC